MNLLAAYVATRIASGQDALPLERLIRRVTDPTWLSLIGDLVTTPVEERPARLMAGVRKMKDLEATLHSLRWAEGDTSADEIAREYPETLGTDLERAREAISEIAWLWPRWVPFGGLTVLGGDSGMGKSFVALRMAQAALGEEEWPDGAPSSEVSDGRTCRVCWIDTEGRYPLLMERTGKWKIDRGRISWPLSPENPLIATPRFILDYPPHWQTVRSYLDDWRPQLTVIDSLSAAHRQDENKGGIKMVLGQLAMLASDLQLAIVVTHSIRKRRQGDDCPVIASYHEIAGHRGHSQYPSSILLLDRLRVGAAGMRLRVDKANFCLAPEPLSVTITDHGLACEDLCQPGSRAEERSIASQLTELLSDGPQPADKIAEHFKAQEVKWRSVRDVSDRLGVVKRLIGRPGFLGGQRSLWELPPSNGSPSGSRPT